MAPALLDPAALDRAVAALPSWSLDSDRTAISCALGFVDFPTAFAFMAAVAIEAEALGHHPDWSNSWATVQITLSTHSAGGLTELDLQLAAKIDVHATRLGAGPR